MRPAINLLIRFYLGFELLAAGFWLLTDPETSVSDRDKRPVASGWKPLKNPAELKNIPKDFLEYIWGP